MDPLKQVSVTLGSAQIAALDEAAQRELVNRSALIRKAVKRFLESENGA